MTGETALSGGTVSLPIKPDASKFGGELEAGLAAEGPRLLSLGKSLGGKLLAGFIGLEIGKKAFEFVSDSVDVAKSAQVANTQLALTVKNAGASYEEFAPKIEAAEKAGRNFGFTNEDTVKALNQLTLGLKDPAKALSVLNVAQDLAKAKNMDLSSAALLVTKGMEGQTRPLKQLGIDLPVLAGNSAAVATAQQKVADAQKKVNDVLAKYPDAADTASKHHGTYQTAVDNLAKAQDNLNSKQSSGDQILQALSQRLGGSAAAAADTYAGKQAAMNATLDNFKEKIGDALLQVLSELVRQLGQPLMDALNGFSDWLGGPGAQAISGAIDWIKQYKDILGPAATAVGVLTGAAWALNIALDANPIGATILAIAALIGYVTLLATNMDKVTAANASMVKAVGDVAFGMMHAVSSFVQGIVNTIIDALNALVGKINPILSALHLPTLKVLGHVDFAGGIAALQGAADVALSGGVGQLTGGAGANGSSNKALHELASGGTILPTPGGTIVKVAEAGRPETVVDTESLNRVAALAMAGGHGSGVTWTGDIYESIDATATAQQVLMKLNQARA